jgi:acylphosphatase
MNREGAHKTVSLRVHGRVQGVFYRAWMVAEATRRGLHGWVRNRSDGTVEAAVSGASAKVDELIAACRTGPPGAAVSRVDVAGAEEAQAARFGPGFAQAPTV